MIERARLTGISEAHTVTQETEPAFWFHMQGAILLALKEDGVLSEAQLSWAEGKLQQQRRAHGWEKGGDTL